MIALNQFIKLDPKQADKVRNLLAKAQGAMRRATIIIERAERQQQERNAVARPFNPDER